MLGACFWGTCQVGWQEKKIYVVQLNVQAVVCRVLDSMRPETRLAVVNVAGLACLIAFTALVYLRTQEPLILVVGGLISVASVIGTTMRKS